MNRRNRLLPLILLVVLAAALAPVTALARQPLWFSPPQIEPTQVIYDSTVTPLPQHMPSYGLEALDAAELGDEVTFAGTSRSLQQVTVTVVSWACEQGDYNQGTCVTTRGSTYSMPITFTIYSVGANDTVDSVIATQTQTFNIPYQPSYDPIRCSSPNYGWYDTESGTCVNGIDANIVFDFSSMAVTLPNTVIYGISYDTSTAGMHPIGADTACASLPAGCPYDTLNIAMAPNVVVGSKPHPDTIFWNTPNADFYCDAPTLGAGVFQLDSPTNACWTGTVPAVQFTAGTPPATGNLAWIYNFVRQFYAFRGR